LIHQLIGGAMTLVRGGARTFPMGHVSVLRNAMN